GRPSHSYHSYMLAGLRLVLAVEVAAGNQHTSKHSSPGLWQLLDRLAPEHQPWVLRGDANFGNEPVMREAGQRHRPYLFKLRLTKGVKRAIERGDGRAGLAGCRRRLARQGRPIAPSGMESASPHRDSAATD